MSVSLSNILEFIVSVIIVKGIVVHFVVGQIDKGLKRWFKTTDRKTAIYEHYQKRALHDGHSAGDVTACGQGACQLFA